jgi:hypothetical protein
MEIINDIRALGDGLSFSCIFSFYKIKVTARFDANVKYDC